MEPRAASGLLVSALLRAIDAAGGSGAVLHRGDQTAGALLLLLSRRGATIGLVERVMRAEGPGWTRIGPDAEQERAAYVERRRRVDPDLWLIELDHDDVRELVAGVSSVPVLF